MTPNFETLLQKYHKEKKSDSRAKTISVLINLLEHSWFSNLNNPLVIQMENSAQEPHEFLFLGYYYFYQNKNVRSLEAFSKALSMLDLSTPTFITQFLFAELIKPEYKKQKKLDGLRKHILSHLIKIAEFEKAFLFSLETNYSDLLPFLFQQINKAFEADDDKHYLVLKNIYYILNRAEFPDNTDKGSVLSHLISSLETMKNNPFSSTIPYLLFKCYNNKGLYSKVANLIRKLSFDQKTLKLALQICFDLSETEPAVVLNTVKALFIEMQVNNTEENKVIGFDAIVSILDGSSKGKLMSIYTKNRAVHEKSTLSKIKYLTEYHKEASLFSIITHSLVGFGTSNTTFLNNRSRWVGGKEHWDQYIAMSSFGNIFSQNKTKPLELYEKLLETCTEDKLPVLSISSHESKSTFNNGAHGLYYMGGILQAVGTVAFNKPLDTDFPVLASTLSSYLNSTNGTTQYGACISVGLLLSQNGYILNSKDEVDLTNNGFVLNYFKIENKLIENIKGKLKTNHFEIGDAAAISLGLIYSGNKYKYKEDFEETRELMVKQLYKTEHSTFKRGLAIGLALMHYKRKDEATFKLSKTLQKENDAYLRMAGVLILSMGYTNSSLDSQFNAVDLLLEVLETEANEDVIFFILVGLSLIMTNNPEQIEHILDLPGVSKHYNMKYKMGACIALGIAVTNSTDSAFIEKVLKTLAIITGDDRRIVQSCAWIGLGLGTTNSKQFERKTNEMFEDVLLSDDVKEITKMGALLGFGFKRAGGQTAGVYCHNKDSFGACAGLIFLGMSYKWFPYLSLVGLSLKHDYKADVGYEVNADKVNLLLLNNSKTMYEDHSKRIVVEPEQSLKQAQSEKWAISKDVMKKENDKTSLKKLIRNKENSVRKLNNLQRLNFTTNDNINPTDNKSALSDKASKRLKEQHMRMKTNVEPLNLCGKKSGVVILDMEQLKNEGVDDLETINL